MHARAGRRAQGERDHDHDAPAPVPTEHPRDQVFAACGYALALAVPATWLLAPYLGARGLPTVLALAALMAPVNLIGIRLLARARSSWSARHCTQANRPRPR